MTSSSPLPLPFLLIDTRVVIIRIELLLGDTTASVEVVVTGYSDHGHSERSEMKQRPSDRPPTEDVTLPLGYFLKFIERIKKIIIVKNLCSINESVALNGGASIYSDSFLFPSHTPGEF